MAQGRMINSKISLSEKVADLSILGQLFYTWSIIHSDDLGILQGSAKTLKAQVIPMIDVTLDEVEDIITRMLMSGLWKELSYGDKKYYKIAKFDENQKLRRDKFPYTVLPIDRTATPKQFWDNLLILIKKIEGKSFNKKLDSKVTKKDVSVRVDTDLSRSGAEMKRNEMKRNEMKRNEMKRSNNIRGSKKENGKTINNGVAVVGDGSLINEIIGMFKPINPSFAMLYRNVGQRSAIQRLIKTHGEDKLKKMIAYLPRVVSVPYSPTISTPVQLEHKMGDLLQFVSKHGKEKGGTVDASEV